MAVIAWWWRGPEADCLCATDQQRIAAKAQHCAKQQQAVSFRSGFVVAVNVIGGQGDRLRDSDGDGRARRTRVRGARSER